MRTILSSNLGASLKNIFFSVQKVLADTVKVSNSTYCQRIHSIVGRAADYHVDYPGFKPGSSLKNTFFSV